VKPTTGEPEDAATYKSSGVDLAAADRVVAEMAEDVTATWTDQVVGGFGGFAAGIQIPSGFESPVLMMSTDGVGTKAEVALRAGMLDGLGYDLVAMCVDDLAAAGATPLAMTDYIALEHLDVNRVTALVKSVAAACAAAGIALLGGETAEHPGVMPTNSFDLAGTALGIMEAGAEITGQTIEPGDLVLGIESPNLRSNGFSFIRATLLNRYSLEDRYPGSDRSVAEVLLEPSIIYSPAIVRLVADTPVKAMAHITGGGISGNLARVLPSQVDARIDTTSWEPAPVFRTLQTATGAERRELYSIFNMGIGFVVVVAPDEAAVATQSLEAAGHGVETIGIVTSGSGVATLT